LLKLSLGVILIYSPLIIFEIFSKGSNIKNLLGFITSPHNNYNYFWHNFKINLTTLTSYLHYKFIPLSFILWTVVTLSTIYILLKKKGGRKIFLLAISLLIPLIILSFTQQKIENSLINNRAYLLVLIPFLYLFLSVIIAQIPSRLFYPVIFFLFGYLLFIDIFEVTLFNKRNTLKQVKQVTNQIVSDLKKRKISTFNFSIHTINSTTSVDWDNSLFWYFIEKKVNKRLIEIEPFSNYAQKIHKNNLQLIYLICHNIPYDKINIQCKDVFLSKQEDFLYLQNSWQFPHNKIFVFSTNKYDFSHNQII